MNVSAKELNEHLSKGGSVQVSTYTKNTVYTGPKWSHLFATSKDGNLIMKKGMRWETLSNKNGLLVSIRKSKLGG